MPLRLLAGRIYPTRNRDVDHEANWFSDRWPVANELLEGQIQRAKNELLRVSVSTCHRLQEVS